MTAGNQPSSRGCDGLWLIVKRGLYFRPDCKGYTGIKDEAGRYKFDFAKNYDRGECKIVREEDGLEFMPVAYNDLVIKHLTAQRDEARAEVARLSGAAQGAVSCGAGLLETNPALFDILNSALGTMHYHRLMSALNWNGYQIVRTDALSAVTPSPGARERADRLEDERNRLQNSYGSGPFADGLITRRIAEIDKELSSLPSTTCAGAATKHSGTFLGYRDEHGNEMHCAHAFCPHQAKCHKGCTNPVAMTSTQSKTAED